MKRIILSLAALHAVAVTMFLAVALSAPDGALVVMDRFSLFMLTACVIGWYALPDDRSALSAGAGATLSLMINPMNMMIGGEYTGVAGFIICVLAGLLIAWFIDDKNAWKSFHFWRKWTSASIALLAGCGSFLYWYGNPYPLEIVRVISITAVLFALALLAAPWSSEDFKNMRGFFRNTEVSR